jgi:ribosomal protein S5
VDVAIAVKKATNEAYKNIFEVPITTGGTVPYMSYTKYKSSVIKLIPASS